MSHDPMDDRLDEEVRFHIDMQTERNIRMGMTPDEARRQANLQFGGRERWKSEARDEYRGRWFDGLRNDFGFAARSLLKHPAFALTAVLTLALGIGASTAIFSVVNAVLLRPLPYANADRLVLIWGDMRARNVTDFPFAPGNYRDLKNETTSFEDIAALAPFKQPIIVPGSDPEQVTAMGVTPNLLPLLGARVLVGRAFNDDDATPPPPPPQRAPGQANAPPPAAPPQRLPTMVLLNYDYWMRRFGGDRSIVGKSVDLGGGTGMVVGVLAPGFEILFPPNTSVPPHPDLLEAFRIDYERSSRLNVFMRLVGRLKDGVSISTARQDAERQSAVMRDRIPIMKAADAHYRVEPMHDDLVADVRPGIFALMGAVTFVLLIACANVGNLLLVRAAARERELAVRAAMGSSPWRIVRQLLAESLLLAGVAALLGLGLAWAGIKLLVALSPSNLPRLEDVHIDPVVLGYTVVAAVVAAALFGIIPAVRAARPDLADVLRSTGRTPGLGGGSLLRSVVVTAEVALSFVLLIGGGLMVRSFVELSRVNPGFDPRNMLTVSIGFAGKPTPQENQAFMQQMHEKLAAIPGVRAVTGMSPVPLDGSIQNLRWGTEEAVADPSKFQQATAHIVLPGYFETMGVKLIAGRTFTEADNRPEGTSIIIDDRLAAKAFPNGPAVGKRLFVRSRGQEAEWMDIIGVVQHVYHESLTDQKWMGAYVPDGYFGHGAVGSWALRVSCTTGERCDPTRITSAVRRAVADLDPKIPVADVMPLQTLVDRAMTPTRFALVLIGIFAAVAAVLACVGLYGVLSTAVRQRTAEIGVRVAFGATRRNILALVIGNGLKLSGAGLAVGLVVAYWLSRAMTTMLVGVKPTDPMTYAIMLLAFLAIAVLACLIPARRAAALDPSIALRSE